MPSAPLSLSLFVRSYSYDNIWTFPPTSLPVQTYNPSPLQVYISIPSPISARTHRHGGFTPSIQLNVPLSAQDLARHAPYVVDHHRPQRLTRRWQHVEPPNRRTPLPCHGQGPRRPELSFWKRGPCRCLWWLQGLPCQGRQSKTAYVGAKGRAGCRYCQRETRAWYVEISSLEIHILSQYWC